MYRIKQDPFRGKNQNIQGISILSVPKIKVNVIWGKLFHILRVTSLLIKYIYEDLWNIFMKILLKII